MADEGFPLPGSSYKELTKIVAGYSETSGPSSPADVGKLIGIHDTQVSRSNKFLVAAGIIEGGPKKTCTTLGMQLGRAIHFDQEEAIVASWRQVVAGTDFLQKIISSIRIRRGMEESALVSHIAFTSGNTKSNTSSAGAGAIIEILQKSGAIKADGATLTAVDLPQYTSTPQDRSSLGIVHVPKPEDEVAKKRSAVEYREDAPALGGSFTHLSISLNITCTPSDLDGLGKILKKLRKEFEDDLEVDVAMTNDADKYRKWDESVPDVAEQSTEDAK